MLCAISCYIGLCHTSTRLYTYMHRRTKCMQNQWGLNSMCYTESLSHSELIQHLFITSINLLWPSECRWYHRTWSTLVQVLTCCLTAPSHYLNQYWLPLIISPVLWHSLMVISQLTLKISIHDMKITNSILQPHLPGSNELIQHQFITSINATACLFSAATGPMGVLKPNTEQLARKFRYVTPEE